MRDVAMMNFGDIISKEVLDLKPSGIRKFFDIANSMEGVISLGVGEPDFRTPWQIRNAGIRALESGSTKYTSNRGLDELRAELTRYVYKKTGVRYDHEKETIVTVGGSEAIDLAIRAIVDPGDEVIIPQPSYVCYEPIVRLCRGVPVIIETRAEEGFKLTPSALEESITERTKAVILPYPSNPTGAVMEKADLFAIAEVMKDKNILVISDEIYSELTFGTDHVSPVSVEGLKERCVMINGFSKAFSMTGWRLGYSMGPEPIINEMNKIHQYAIMCAPTVSQHAAVEALRFCEAEVERMREEYDDRRRIIVHGFNSLGLRCTEPRGAFYAFPSVRGTGLSDTEFCERLLYSKKVALVPGSAFGKGGEEHVRASYCYSISHIKEALSRISEFLREL